MAKEMEQEENPVEKENRIQSYVTFKEGKRFGQWTIGQKLDEGGFGKVYLVTRKDGQKAALKAEPNEVEGGSAIKLEMALLKDLNSKGEQPHIPFVFHGAKHRKFCYMIITLLGDNLKGLRIRSSKDSNGYATLSVSTWIRLGIQCLYALKLLHDNGYLHRDIKPNNFLIGHPSDKERSRLVYILDFGLSRSYAFKKDNRWICRLARSTAEFRGTVRYCSPNVHDELEQGRRDDIWSLFYVLIELHCGLPWQTQTNKQKIETQKCTIKDEHLTQKLPRELRGVIPALRKLDCYQRPDYLEIYNCMVAVMKRHKVNADDPYDWEKAPDYKILKPSKPPLWHDPVEFFKSDPINIHGAPSVADRQVDVSSSNKMEKSRTKDASKEDKSTK